MMALLRYLLAFVSVGIGGLVRAQAEGSTYDVLDYVDQLIGSSNGGMKYTDML